MTSSLPPVHPHGSPSVIIFGAEGQDGQYLAQFYRERSAQVVCVSRAGGGIRGSVADADLVERLVKAQRPGAIFHLAANSTTRHDALFENHATISTGTLNILESVFRHSRSTRVFITGSGLQFKNNGQPISERDDFEALSPYAAARIHSVYAARYYRSLGIAAYVGYLFHHESPLRGERHVSQMIAQAVQRIAGGAQETIEIGDLKVRKEWTFAGDVARGMMKLIEQDIHFEATIGSGQAYAIEEWLAQCFQVIGKNWQDHVRCKDGFSAEYQRLVSNPATIRSLGWQPQISFNELARIMVTSI
jgi:GDPmannose 4,6-dehydratase